MKHCKSTILKWKKKTTLFSSQERPGGSDGLLSPWRTWGQEKLALSLRDQLWPTCVPSEHWCVSPVAPGSFTCVRQHLSVNHTGSLTMAAQRGGFTLATLQLSLADTLFSSQLQPLHEPLLELVSIHTVRFIFIYFSSLDCKLLEGHSLFRSLSPCLAQPLAFSGCTANACWHDLGWCEYVYKLVEAMWLEKDEFSSFKFRELWMPRYIAWTAPQAAWEQYHVTEQAHVSELQLHLCVQPSLLPRPFTGCFFGAKR